jgi:nucleotide-binding universal stress UspA family protein
MRKIVVGVDLSPHSSIAVAHALDLARRDGAEVVVTLVHKNPEPPVFGMYTEDARDAYHAAINARLAADRDALSALVARSSGDGVPISELVVSGEPDEVLPRVALEIGAELIVLGSHGRTGFTRLVMGSVAERVARLATCSVLVARGERSATGYRHVVVGTDFTHLARVALSKAIAVAGDARIDIVHCWQPPVYAAPVDSPVVESASLHMRHEAREGVEEQGAALIASVRTSDSKNLRFHVVEARDWEGLTDFARTAGADLIVVGSHGRRGLRRFLLGSVAELTARHAPCSTLIARA